MCVGVCSYWEGGRDGVEEEEGGRYNKRAKQNKEGTENNLKLCIDPAVVIVHIFHSPIGPIPVSLKCKERKKGNKKKKWEKNDGVRQKASHSPSWG